MISSKASRHLSSFNVLNRVDSSCDLPAPDSRRSIAASFDSRLHHSQDRPQRRHPFTEVPRARKRQVPYPSCLVGERELGRSGRRIWSSRHLGSQLPAIERRLQTTSQDARVSASLSKGSSVGKERVVGCKSSKSSSSYHRHRFSRWSGQDLDQVRYPVKHSARLSNVDSPASHLMTHVHSPSFRRPSLAKQDLRKHSAVSVLPSVVGNSNLTL
jgi:hypothetical protein